MEVDISVLASFLASNVLSFWFEVLGANVVGDVVCVLSCEVLFFSQTASGILLCSVCNQFGDASVIRCFASLFQTAIISMLQVWLEKFLVHPSTRLALHMWVLSWGWCQAWCSILGYLAPMLCRHWCSCSPSWVEIRRWRLVARYTSQIIVRESCTH